MNKKIVLIFLLVIFSFFLYSQDYDFSVFTFDEVNTLRQVKPIKRLRIYRKVILKYSGKMTFSLNFLNYKRVESLNDKLEKVLMYTTRDLLRCISDKRNRTNPHIRYLYQALVVCTERLKGVKRGLPPERKDMVDDTYKKSKYLKGLLQKYIFGKGK